MIVLLPAFTRRSLPSRIRLKIEFSQMPRTSPASFGLYPCRSMGGSTVVVAVIPASDLLTKMLTRTAPHGGPHGPMRLCGLYHGTWSLWHQEAQNGTGVTSGHLGSSW